LNRSIKTDALFTIESHHEAHNTTYDAARTDLMSLAELGPLIKSKIGHAFAFAPVSDLLVLAKREEFDPPDPCGSTVFKGVDTDTRAVAGLL